MSRTNSGACVPVGRAYLETCYRQQLPCSTDFEMADYTSLGIDKLTRQANRDITLVRCPRDGVVMRVLSCRAARYDGSGEECRVVGRLPRGRAWAVREIDFECPACSRRARGISVQEHAPRHASGSVAGSR